MALGAGYVTGSTATKGGNGGLHPGRTATARVEGLSVPAPWLASGTVGKPGIGELPGEPPIGKGIDVCTDLTPR